MSHHFMDQESRDCQGLVQKKRALVLSVHEIFSNRWAEKSEEPWSTDHNNYGDIVMLVTELLVKFLGCWYPMLILRDRAHQYLKHVTNKFRCQHGYKLTRWTDSGPILVSSPVRSQIFSLTSNRSTRTEPYGETGRSVLGDLIRVQTRIETGVWSIDEGKIRLWNFKI